MFCKVFLSTDIFKKILLYNEDLNGHINICLRNKNLAMHWKTDYQSIMKSGILKLANVKSFVLSLFYIIIFSLMLFPQKYI